MMSEKAKLIQLQTKEVCDNIAKIKDMIESNMKIVADNSRLAKALGKEDAYSAYSRAILDLQSALGGLRCASSTMENVSKMVRHLK